MTNAERIRIVAGREFKDRATSKAFLVGTGIMLVALLALIILPKVLSDDGRPSYSYGLLGERPDTFEPALGALAEAFEVDLERIAVADQAAAETLLDDGTVDVVINGLDEFLVVDELPNRLEALLVQTVQQTAVVERLLAEGVAPEALGSVLGAQVEPTITARDDVDSDERDTRRAIASIGVILLFISVTTNAGMILSGAIEEKSSRVIEVLLGTLRPWQLLSGKLVGLGALALSQFTLLVGTGLVAGVASGALDLPPGTLAAVPLTFVWFLLGFAFFASVYAVAGAISASVEDAQSAAAPVGLILMAGYILSLIVVAENPMALPARLLSFVPPLAPMIVPTRLASGAVPLWESLLAIAVSAVAIVLTVRLAGRLYGAAVLQGGKVGWRDLFRTDEFAGLPD